MPVIIYDTKHGKIAVEVEDAPATPADGGLISRGSLPLTAKGPGVVEATGAAFESAMETVRAYVASIQDVVGALDLTPKEVAVELSLKMTADAGFVLVTTGTEATFKLALKWDPSGAK